MGVTAELPNIQRQNGETKKYALNKEQTKSPEKELNETEATKILDAEFKIMIVRMLKDVRERMDDLSQNLNKETVNIKKDIETIKDNQSVIKNTISEMKEWLGELNGRLNEAEDQISNLEDKITQAEHQKEKRVLKK